MIVEESFYPPINKKLSHLSLEEIDEIIELYYSGEKVKEIAEAFNLKISNSELLSLLPPEVISDKKCKYCNHVLWKDRVARSSSFNNREYCPACGHIESFSCNCSNCQADREEKKVLEENRIKKILLSRICVDNYNPIHYQDISFINKIYTGALLRIGLSEDMEVINPFDSFDEKLTPINEFDKEIFNILIKEHIIEISPYSFLSAFYDVKDDGSFLYYKGKVFWHLNVVCPGKDRSVIIDNFINPIKWIESENEEILALWKKIAIFECIEYLLYNLDLVGFNFSPGKKTKLVFEDLLNSFSTAQIFGIIWHSVTYASRYYQEGNISKKHAANSVITNCQNYAEKALTSGWNLKRFNRGKDYPQSSISQLFYNRILKIGDDGFYEIPRKINIDKD